MQVHCDNGHDTEIMKPAEDAWQVETERRVVVMDVDGQEITVNKEFPVSRVIHFKCPECEDTFEVREDME
jgi:predicted RNA-binding Zn-ribbon protein involved in translation (DUF1610 family)